MDGFLLCCPHYSHWSTFSSHGRWHSGDTLGVRRFPRTSRRCGQSRRWHRRPGLLWWNWSIHFLLFQRKLLIDKYIYMYHRSYYRQWGKKNICIICTKQCKYLYILYIYILYIMYMWTNRQIVYMQRYSQDSNPHDFQVFSGWASISKGKDPFIPLRKHIWTINTQNSGDHHGLDVF
jgi:hypothetical protein